MRIAAQVRHANVIAPNDKDVRFFCLSHFNLLLLVLQFEIERAVGVFFDASSDFVGNLCLLSAQ
jgi:hypothetical protein